MELVNQMLQAAMAEDGDESDEVKEEYGKKVDETLADLREKLEEARRAEGKLPLSTPSQKADSGDEAGTALPKEVGASLDFSELQRVSELESALAASQEQVRSRAPGSIEAKSLILDPGLFPEVRTRGHANANA